MKLLKLFTAVLLVMCFSCQKNIHEGETLSKGTLLFTENNEVYDLSVEFWGGREGNEIQEIVIKKNNDAFVHAPADKASLIESRGFYTNVWSPDGEYLVLPIGRFQGFRIYHSNKLFNNQKGAAFRDFKMAMTAKTQAALWHEYKGWQDDHTLIIAAGLSGKRTSFSIDLSQNSVTTETEHYRAYIGLMDVDKIAVQPLRP